MFFKDLDPAVREQMLREIEFDLAAANLFISPRLSASGRSDYPSLLSQAAAHEDVSWLVSQLNSHGRMKTHEQRRHPTAGEIVAKVPSNAAELIGEGEFNRFYIRGLCRQAMQTAETRPLIAYRAKQVRQPRPESDARIGLQFQPDTLLADLRSNVGVDTAFGIPSGPCSGLSICFGEVAMQRIPETVM